MKLYKNGWGKKNKVSPLYPILLVTALLLGGCSSSPIVQPLNKGQWQASLNAGGPIVKGDNDNTSPVPLSSASLAYGFSQTTTGYAGAGITSQFHDVNQFNIGFTHELIAPFAYQPGISFSPQLNIFQDKRGPDSQFYPQLDINAYWLSYFRNDYFYLGISNWFDLSSTRAHQQKQNTHWLPAIQAGYTFQGDRYGLNLEMKYIAPNKNNENNLIEYIGIKNQGVIGLYLSLSRKFR